MVASERADVAIQAIAQRSRILQAQRHTDHTARGQIESEADALGFLADGGDVAKNGLGVASRKHLHPLRYVFSSRLRTFGGGLGQFGPYFLMIVGTQFAAADLVAGIALDADAQGWTGLEAALALNTRCQLGQIDRPDAYFPRELGLAAARQHGQIVFELHELCVLHTLLQA